MEASIRLNVAPFYGSDRVLWRGAAYGILTTKAAYDSLCVVRFEIAWCKIILKPFIPPSRFILYWKILHNHLPMKDKLIAKGTCLILVYRLCYREGESMVHLFLECTYACSFIL